MKSGKSVAIIVLIGICLILLPKPGRAEQKIGIGGKLVGNIPLLIGSFDFDQFGVEVGGGMRSAGTNSGTYSYNMSLIYYLANAKYIFPLSKQLQPYMGGGMIGVNASVSTSTEITDTTVSGGTNGFDVFGGLQVPLDSYGLPLTVFGGVNYLGFGDMTFTYEGESFTFPLGVSGTSFHIGVKFTF